MRCAPIRIEEIEKKLAKVELERQEWMTAIAVYERCKCEPIGDFPELAFRAYIVMGSTTDAAQALNNAGQRNGRKKFEPGDISTTIDSTNIEDIEIMKVARFLLKGGRIRMNKIFN